MIDAVKKAEDSDSLIVRLHDYSGMREKVVLTSDLNVVSWQECDLMERPIGEPQAADRVEFNLLPYELRTFKLDIRA